VSTHKPKHKPTGSKEPVFPPDYGPGYCCSTCAASIPLTPPIPFTLWCDQFKQNVNDSYKCDLWHEMGTY
jgi:hypothetical protein